MLSIRDLLIRPSKEKDTKEDKAILFDTDPNKLLMTP
jgi:hypothetical protein